MRRRPRFHTKLQPRTSRHNPLPRTLQMSRWAVLFKGACNHIVVLHKPKLFANSKTVIWRTSFHTASDYNAVYYFITEIKICQEFFDIFFLFFHFSQKISVFLVFTPPFSPLASPRAPSPFPATPDLNRGAFFYPCPHVRAPVSEAIFREKCFFLDFCVCEGLFFAKMFTNRPKYVILL